MAKNFFLKCAKIALVKQKSSGLENTYKNNFITPRSNRVSYWNCLLSFFLGVWFFYLFFVCGWFFMVYYLFIFLVWFNCWVALSRTVRPNGLCTAPLLPRPLVTTPLVTMPVVTALAQRTVCAGPCLKDHAYVYRALSVVLYGSMLNVKC